MIKKKYLGIALGLHLLIFLKISNSVHPNTTAINPVISTYLYADNANLPLSAKSFPSKKEVAPTNLHQSFVIKPKRSLSVTKNINDRFMLRANAKESKNHRQEKNHHLFLQRLHEAIAAKQSYPEWALEQHHKGSVKIRFLIYPNGQFSQFYIQNSSGYQELDTAALSALQEVAPFKEAKLYLQNPQYFSVNIVFASTDPT